MLAWVGLQEERRFNLMGKQAPLIEGGQGIDGALEQSDLGHVVVQIQILLDLEAPLLQDFCEASGLAGDLTNDGFNDE